LTFIVLSIARVLLNYNHLTTTRMNDNAKKITAADPPATPSWNFSAKPWDSPATGAGIGGTGDTATGTGNAGTSSYNSSTCKYSCSLQPTNGPQGGAGKTPDPPPKAADGRPTGNITQNLGVCKGVITIWYGAGDGQKGGAGGKGGPGGTGGQPGNCPTGCTAASTGPQGPGGKGGTGGQGGNGGVTGLINLFYTDAGASFDVTQVGCGAGNGGDPGLPGDGPTNLGGGNTGPGGTASKPPNINFNKQ
jgi:hypothetical protein